MTAIQQKYMSLDGPGGLLGKPTNQEQACPDGVGRFQHFQNGSIYWHPFTGAREVHGLIRAKWSKLGWEQGVLGYPKTDESDCPVQKGRYNLFQGGTILWVPGAKEAFEVHGAIRSKWASLGFESGLLGFPVSDESKTPDGTGRYNHFQNGSVYWKPSLGAHEVHGLIRGLWAEQGWEKNPALGYPISDELPAYPGSKHRFNDFENGVVYWKHGSSKASALAKLTLKDTSTPSADVVKGIRDAILPLLKVDEHVYVKSGPSLVQVTDYHYDGERVRNRRYLMRTVLGVDVPVAADPWIRLDLYIGIEYAPQSHTVVSFLDEWNYHVHVPAITSAVISAKSIGDKLKKHIPPLLGKPQAPKQIDEHVKLLSAKVQANGDFDVFVQPLLDSKT